MSKCKFNKSIFNKGFAITYTVLQYVFLGGFVAALLIVIASASVGATITIPDLLLPVVCAYLFVSLAGFPIVTALKAGARRLVENSVLTIGNDGLIYNRLADKLWTAAGHVEEHYVYTASQIEGVISTKRFCIVKGNIEIVVINNGRTLKTMTATSMKIPKAFDGLERIK